MDDKPADNENQKDEVKEEKADDTLSWEDVGEDLAQQKELIQESTQNKKPIQESAQNIEPIQESAQNNVKDPSFDKFKDGGKIRTSHNLDFILDIPLQITVELGRTSLLVNDLLQLGQGSVIELSKLVGEPLDVLINGKEVARGEVVVVNEKFGIRLTDIIDPLERVRQLRSPLISH
jgi:flagellar motor switch protein FliN/FliY